MVMKIGIIDVDKIPTHAMNEFCKATLEMINRQKEKQAAQEDKHVHTTKPVQ